MTIQSESVVRSVRPRVSERPQSGRIRVATLAAVLRSPDVWGCVLLAVGFVVTLRVNPWAWDNGNDFPVYLGDVHGFFSGLLPYRSVFFEYPPLAVPVLTVPGLVGTAYFTYLHAFAAEMFAFGALLVMMIRRTARLTGGSEWLAALAVGVSPLLMGAVMRSRFDLAPVAILAAALFLLVRGRPKLGLAVLGLAVLTKGFPLVAAPAALAWLWARDGRRVAAQSAISMCVVVLVVMGAATAISPHGVLQSLTFQTNRPVQLESTPASILFGLSHLGAIGAPLNVHTYRQFGLLASGSGAISLLVIAAGLLTILGFAVGVFRSPGRRELVLAVGGAIAAYAAFGKVYSPQYAVWALPLFAMAVAWRRYSIALVLGVAMVLTMYEYSHLILGVEHNGAWTAVVAVRNVLTIAGIWLALGDVLGVRALLRRRAAVAVATS